jgi:catechol 2,3-dioxygenase-like lactoylglutathione lyase family enzyme
MRIDHIAAIVSNLEDAQRLLTKAFGFKSAQINENPKLGFRSVFLTCENIRIELIQKTTPHNGPYGEAVEGFNHLAISVKEFDSSLRELSAFGIKKEGEPILGRAQNLDSKTTAGIKIQLLKS